MLETIANWIDDVTFELATKKDKVDELNDDIKILEQEYEQLKTLKKIAEVCNETTIV